MTTTVDETTTPDTPETPDEPETPEEPEAEPEPPVTPPESNEALMEQVFGQAQKRAKSYMKAVPELLGAAAADLSLCPRCTDLLPGFILPPQVKPVVGDQLVAVKLSIGEGLPVEYASADDASQCQACQGQGKVKTGSHVPKQDVLRCRHCEGRGWIGPRAAAMPAAAVEVNGHADIDYAPPVEEAPELDPWGRTRSDPLYGVMPGFEPR